MGNYGSIQQAAMGARLMLKPPPVVPPCNPARVSLLDRRGFLIGAGAAGVACGAAINEAYTQFVFVPYYSLRIVPFLLEFAPGKVIETFAYNVAFPGPTLRF